MQRNAFTLVELLVVIAIIGLLSTVAVVNLQTSRDNAKTTKARADLKQLSTIIDLARQLNNSTLYSITGSPCSFCFNGCDTGDLRNIDESSSCAQWTLTQFNKIYAAAGMTARTTVLRDSWGSPYQMDENEGENSYPDGIWSVGSDGARGTSDDIRVDLPKFGS